MGQYNRILAVLIILTMAYLLVMKARADDFYVYPAKGQSKEQTSRDKFDCYEWAREESQFDPMALPETTTPPPRQTQPQQSRAGGAFRGAITGAIIGEIADDKGGEGAAIGALAGGLISGTRRRQHHQEAEIKRQHWEQQQAHQYADARHKYNRAYTACLEARGYSVK